MKKNKFILGVVACAFAALAMTGCSLTLGNSDDRVVTSGYKLTSISLDTTNVTKAFIKGAEFSYEGLVVNGTYADNSTKVIKEYTVSTPDMNKCEEQTVTVTAADNATATYKITVTLPVKSIAIKADTYVVTATYEDGSTKTIPGADIEWSYDSTAKEIVATYFGKTVTVVVPEGNNIKKAYDAGVSAKALYDAGVSAKAMHDAGISYIDMVKDGINPTTELTSYYSIIGTGTGYEGATHKMNVGFARDGGVEYKIAYATLNGVAKITEDTNINNVGFINNPTGTTYIATEGGDFTILAVADFTGVSCNEVWGPWNIVIQDIDKPGEHGWVARPDYWCFDPLPSYKTVTYEGQSNWYADPEKDAETAAKNGHNYDGKKAIIKVTGTNTVVRTDVYIVE